MYTVEYLVNDVIMTLTVYNRELAVIWLDAMSTLYGAAVLTATKSVEVSSAFERGSNDRARNDAGKHHWNALKIASDLYPADDALFEAYMQGWGATDATEAAYRQLKEKEDAQRSVEPK